MIGLKEAYEMVLADLEHRDEVERLRDRVSELLEKQRSHAVFEDVVTSIKKKDAKAFRYVGMLMRDAVAAVLTEAGGGRSSTDLIRTLTDGGYSDVSRQTLHACMSKGVKSGIFVEVEKHVWDLAERYQSETKPADPAMWEGAGKTATAGRSSGRRTSPTDVL